MIVHILGDDKTPGAPKFCRVTPVMLICSVCKLPYGIGSFN